MDGTNKSFKSVIWLLCSLVEGDKSKVKCNICGKIYSRGGKLQRAFNTSNIKKHLKSHKAEWSEACAKYEKQNKQSAPPPVSTYLNSMTKKLRLEASTSASSTADTINLPSTSQQTLEQCYETKKIWDINDSRSKSIHFKIGEMIALDCQPFSIVEDLGFNNLLKHLKPNYKLPSRHFMSEKIIPSIYSATFDYISDVIKKCKFISIDTDIWGALSSDSFISFTAHCVFEDFEQQVVVLRVMPFCTNHTGDNITEWINDMIKSYKIPREKIHNIVHDNATNMVLGVENTGIDSLRCFLHTNQLTIGDCILDQAYVKNILSKSRDLTSHFSRSDLAYAKLRDIQRRLNRPLLKFKGDVVTRWNSQFIMIKRLLEMKPELLVYISENSSNCTISFDSAEWEMMQKIVDLLEIFNNMTERY